MGTAPRAEPGTSREPPACWGGGGEGAASRWLSTGSRSGTGGSSPHSNRVAAVSPEWNNGFHLLGLWPGGGVPVKRLAVRRTVNVNGCYLRSWCPLRLSPRTPWGKGPLETASCARNPGEGLLVRLKTCCTAALSCIRSITPYSGPLEYCQLST